MICARPAPLLVCLLLLACGGEPEDPRFAQVRQCLAENPDAARTRVLVLGFDAADLDIIDSMIDAGDLPAFARVRREGASGKLRSFTPLLSPVVWTTIATGRGPDAHGVLDWEVTDPETGAERPASSYQRQTESIWDILGTYGSKVGVVGWLVTWPAEPVNGFLVSNRARFLAYRQIPYEPEGGRRVHPASLMPRIRALVRDAETIPYQEIRPFLNISEEEYRSSFARALAPNNPGNGLRLYYSSSELCRRSGIELWKTEKPRFQATYFKFLDSVGHLFMLYAPPRIEDVPVEAFAKYRGAMDESYRYIDRILAQAMEVADEDTVILIVSDHGFKSGIRRPPIGAKFIDRWATRWHREYGVFYAWGKGVRPGAHVTGATVFDVAPTVLGLMGYPSAEDMPGRFLAEAFTMEPPGAVVGTYERGRAERVKEKRMAPGEEDDLIRGDLAALGYLGGGKKSVSSHLHLGTFYLSKGRFDEALEEARAALEKVPESVHALAFLGRVYEQRGEYEKATRAFAEVLRIDPSHSNARVHLALSLRVLGNKEESIRELRIALEQRPDDASAHLNLGRFLIDEGKREEGEALIVKAFELEPDFPECRNQLGMLLVKAGKFDEAAGHFLAAVDLDPKYIKAWNNLGVAQLRRAAAIKDPQAKEEALDTALATFDRIVVLFPDYSKGYYNRARLRSYRNQRELAAADAKKALELDPEYAEARRLLERLGIAPGK